MARSHQHPVFISNLFIATVIIYIKLIMFCTGLVHFYSIKIVFYHCHNSLKGGL